jgi:hypothetical protein
MVGDYKLNAGRLAARAYVKASMHVAEREAKDAYRALALKAVKTHSDWSFDNLESEFRREMADAKAWYAKVEANERDWIRDGSNPEAEFAKLYYSEPAVTAGDGAGSMLMWGLLAAVAIAFVLAYRKWRVRRAERLRDQVPA